MATFVLVHGGFQGGWVWKEVAAGLRAAGHTVYHPSLDGCGERKGGLRAGITLDTHGQEIADLLFYEDLQDAILVSTSGGGFVICRAAEIARERISRLVFIDALVPKTGESATSINNQPERDSTDIAHGVQPEDAPGKVFLDADLTPAQRDWAVARYTRHPRSPSSDPCDLRAFWQQKWQADVLCCTQSRFPSTEHQKRAAELLGGSYAELDAGHLPMISRPAEVTRYLLDLAK